MLKADDIVNGLIFVIVVALCAVMYANKSIFLSAAFGIASIVWLLYWIVKGGLKLMSESEERTKEGRLG